MVFVVIEPFRMQTKKITPVEGKNNALLLVCMV